MKGKKLPQVVVNSLDNDFTQTDASQLSNSIQSLSTPTNNCLQSLKSPTSSSIETGAASMRNSINLPDIPEGQERRPTMFSSLSMSLSNLMPFDTSMTDIS